MTQLPAGASAPDFELHSIEGGSRRLAGALKRGPVVLVFYKSSCPTCRFAFPFIQKIAEAAGKNPPWTLWAVSQDEPEETREFVKHHGLTFEVLIDEHPYPVSAAYGLKFVPTLFMIEPGGTITLSEFGFTKAGLNQIAGFEFFKPDDGLPLTRPG